MNKILIGLGMISAIPFVAMIVQLAIRDARHQGYCDTLFEDWLIPIVLLLSLGIGLVMGGWG